MYYYIYIIILYIYICEGVSVIPVLYVVLHIKIVDQQWVTEFSITHGFIQRETWQSTEKEKIITNK